MHDKSMEEIRLTMHPPSIVASCKPGRGKKLFRLTQFPLGFQWTGRSMGGGGEEEEEEAEERAPSGVDKKATLGKEIRGRWKRTKGCHFR